MCWCNVCLWILVTEGIQLSEDVKSLTCGWKEVCGHVIEEPSPPPRCTAAAGMQNADSSTQAWFRGVFQPSVRVSPLTHKCALSALYRRCFCVPVMRFWRIPCKFRPSSFLLQSPVGLCRWGSNCVCFLLIFLIVCISLDEDHFLTIALLISVLLFHKYPSTVRFIVLSLLFFFVFCDAQAIKFSIVLWDRKKSF